MAEEIREQVLDAIRHAQRRIHWRPGKAETHLLKRIRLGHLEPGTTLDEYETVIRQVMNDQDARIYVFIYQRRRYPTLVSSFRASLVGDVRHAGCYGNGLRD